LEKGKKVRNKNEYKTYTYILLIVANMVATQAQQLPQVVGSVQDRVPCVFNWKMMEIISTAKQYSTKILNTRSTLSQLNSID
jgi:hypothetical protein